MRRPSHSGSHCGIVRMHVPATYLHLGFALKESGRIEEAVSAWQQVLRLAPTDTTALEELKQAGHSGKRAHQLS